MKLITLNAWGGHIEKPFFNFIEDNHDTDVFCFQEIYKDADSKISTDGRTVDLNLFSDLENILSNHIGFFRPVVAGSFGMCIFVKKSIQVLGEGEVIIHDNPEYAGLGPTHPRNLQWVKLYSNNKEWYILNVHGLWNGNGKTDTPERILQSEKIKSFANSIKNPMIIAGDFNLRPDTKSLEIIAAGLNNLVEIYDIHSTRTSYYTKEERYADYIFTSSNIQVQNFAVMPNEVSDHSPLVVEFTL